VAAKIESALAAASPAAPAIRWFRSQPACAGVTNGYRNPGQLGCDRFASLIGARHRYPGRALLIVTAGTATTVDALDATGRFVGGMILPGLRTMAQSLAVNTALLPAVEDARTERLFADNTQDAIVSGCIHAQVGAILQAHAQWPAALCVLSGGGAPYIGPQLPFACERIDNLVVLGLHVAALTEAK
jgi:type III pantothenate kinase